MTFVLRTCRNYRGIWPGEISLFLASVQLPVQMLLGRERLLWRKTSGGTDGPQGSRFVERVLTVVHTCRQQGKNVLAFLSACVEAWRHGRAPPGLLEGGR